MQHSRCGLQRSAVGAMRVSGALCAASVLGVQCLLHTRPAREPLSRQVRACSAVGGCALAAPWAVRACSALGGCAPAAQWAVARLQRNGRLRDCGAVGGCAIAAQWAVARLQRKPSRGRSGRAKA